MSVNGIFYSKKTKVLGITTAVISLVSLSLNLLLIPTFGIYGAAVTMVSCYFILFVVTYSVSQRYYFIKWNWKKIVLNLSICIIIFLLGLVNFNGFTYNFLYKIILFMVYILMLFVFKILTYEVLHKFFKIIVPKNR